MEQREEEEEQEEEEEEVWQTDLLEKSIFFEGNG